MISLAPNAAAGLERSGKAGPIAMALAALDLDDLVDELPVAAVQPGLDRGALGFEAKPLSPCFAVETRK